MGSSWKWGCLTTLSMCFISCSISFWFARKLRDALGFSLSSLDLRDILSRVGSASARRPMLRLVATFLRRFCAFLVALAVSSFFKKASRRILRFSFLGTCLASSLLETTEMLSFRSSFTLSLAGSMTTSSKRPVNW
uniref:Uncharacterized protein n=1 Tax=Ixodes ricinus TaxID=34613 RepID=A0A6B0US55_IXORI